MPADVAGLVETDGSREIPLHSWPNRIERRWDGIFVDEGTGLESLAGEVA